MTWLKIDDKFSRHPKVLGLSDKAFRLHVAALCGCSEMLTDGYVSVTDLRMLSTVVHCRNVTRYVEELIEAQLWHTHRKGWRINDFLEYNPSSIKVKEQRERNALRQKLFRDRNAVTNGAPSRPVSIEKELPQKNVLVDELIQQTADSFGGVL